jgi:hypothetical protein
MYAHCYCVWLGARFNDLKVDLRHPLAKLLQRHVRDIVNADDAMGIAHTEVCHWSTRVAFEGGPIMRLV